MMDPVVLLARIAAFGSDPVFVLLCFTVACMSAVGGWRWLALPVAALPVAVVMEWIVASHGYLGYRFGHGLFERWLAATVLLLWQRALLAGAGALLRRLRRR